MPDASIDFEVKEFQRALALYIGATGKTIEEATNRAARNLAFRTGAAITKSSRGKIHAVSLQSWWPKLIAKILRTSPGVGGYDVDDARELSKRLLNKRKRSTSFMKSGVMKAAAKAGEGKAKANPRLTKSKGYATKATEFDPVATIRAVYDARDGKDARRKEILLRRAMKKAIIFVTNDMRKYAEKKLRKKAKELSAR